MGSDIAHCARAFAVALAVVGATTGCVGAIGSGDPEDGAADGASDGAADGTSTLGISQTRRLTRHEIENTVRALFGDDAAARAGIGVDGLPADQNGTAFTTNALDVTGAQVDGFYRLADVLSAAVAEDAALRAVVAPCLATLPADATCVDALVSDFGARVYRRPLTGDEATALRAIYDEGATLTATDGVRFTLLAMLQAPAFVYRFELDGTETDDADVLALSPREIAVRLSYVAWGAPPDDALLQRAADGSLTTDDVLAAEAARLFSDPKSHAWVGRFFNEWLAVSPKGVDAALGSAMREELDTFVATQVFDRRAPLDDLMTSNTTYLPTEELASIYGLSGTGEVTMPPERAGIVSLPAMLAGSGDATHPIQRGAVILKRLLCVDVSVPTNLPPGTIAPPPFDPARSARDRWTAQTSAPGCAACHTRINPFGFALERFDNRGAFRDEEPIVDPTSGDVYPSLPIDTVVEVEIDAGVRIPVSDVVTLGRALASSTTLDACFAKKFFSFAMGRAADDDVPSVDALVEAATQDGGSMRDMFEKLATSPAFKVRRIAR